MTDGDVIKEMQEAADAEFLLMGAEGGAKDGKDHVFVAGGVKDGRFSGRIARVTRARGMEMAQQAKAAGMACLLGEPVRSAR